MSNPNATAPSSSDDLTSPYHYDPTQSVCLVFLILFSISTVLHLAEAIRFKLWWLLPTAVLAGFGEIVGWVGRYWSSINVLNGNAFLMQITTTIIAPTPLLAANFIIFGQIILILGEEYSRLRSRMYSRIFLTCDIIALVVQGTGGGIASSANTQAGSNLGANIMLGGIVFQEVALVAFILLATEYYVRFFKSRPLRTFRNSYDSSATLVRTRQWSTKLKLSSFGLAFSCTVLFIRSVYRTIELADGWNGRIISTQIYFNVLDGAMIVLAMYTLNIFHPGLLLKDAVAATSEDGALEVKNVDYSDSNLPSPARTS